MRQLPECELKSVLCVLLVTSWVNQSNISLGDIVWTRRVIRSDLSALSANRNVLALCSSFVDSLFAVLFKVITYDSSYQFNITGKLADLLDSMEREYIATSTKQLVVRNTSLLLLLTMTDCCNFSVSIEFHSFFFCHINQLAFFKSLSGTINEQWLLAKHNQKTSSRSAAIINKIVK